MTITAAQPRIGSKAWADHVKDAIRKRHGLKADDDVRLTAVAAAFDADSGDPHRFTARITKNVSDRDNEVVLPSGGDFSEFAKSGAVFWNHDYDKPVAIAGKLTKTSGDEEVVAQATWMKRPGDMVGEFHPDFARAFVTQMREHGKMAGVSIGFIPLESRRPSKKDLDRYGDNVTNVITRWKLLEWSIAPVQSNPEAYVTMVGKSLGVDACKALFGVAPKADAAPEFEPVKPIEPAPPAAKRVVNATFIFITPAPPKPKRKAIDIEQIIVRAVAAHEAKRKGWPLYA